MSGSLNKRQRQWVDDFLSIRPNGRLTSIYKDMDIRIVTIEWRERVVDSLLDSTTAIRGEVKHKIRVKLSRIGKPKFTANYSYKVQNPHKEEIDYAPQGQLVLDLPQAYEFKPPSNPVVVKQRNPTTRKKVAKPVQQVLPLSGVSADLLQIEIKNGGTVKSEQELLSEITPHRTLEGKEITLPAAIVKVLQAKQATLKEWEGAIDLYQVAGPSAVLSYLEGLDFLREYFGTKVVQKQKDGTISISQRVH